jgi:isoleucyl-tRNA synthetase
LKLEDYNEGDKAIPFEVVKEIKGTDLADLRYEQLMPYQQPTDGDAFKILLADFVTTEDGTGIVHLAPSFGSDDFMAAKKNGIGSLTLVDKQGKFIDNMGEFSGAYVKNYTDEDESAPGYQTTDVKIAIKLKTENKAFKVEKYEHSYPHCWRTDKPVLYYPLESWFIKTTAVKDRLVELNNTINWKPASTGTGRFGNWLENLVDWNLSRSRYWGTPLPIWKNGEEQICIGSIEELKAEVDKSVAAGFMTENPVNDSFDLHRPFIDDIILVSDSGKPLTRETDLIDVWFDSGAMPYAQVHYPFENKEDIESNTQYPADFIAEGVDQTRGWFFTLHAISVMLNDSVAYKNVMANGLVQDKNGNKMSKRLGNSIDPFETVDKHGADVIRWYMLSNASPWDNLKFDIAGLDETKRKFFGTLYNVYGFYALYANIDGFVAKDKALVLDNELDRWIISKMHSLTQEVESLMDDYEPTRATRMIQDFVIDDLSNWYVRLNRRRFWKGEMSDDKANAYTTLYTVLNTVSKLTASFIPFFSERLYQDLNLTKEDSVHLQNFPKVNEGLIDTKLEEQVNISQKLTSLILRIRKLENIKVRQPLSKVLIPSLSDDYTENLKNVIEVIKSEVNVKEAEIIAGDSDIIKKSCKPNFKLLGKKVGASMKWVAAAISNFNNDQIVELEAGNTVEVSNGTDSFHIALEEVELQTAEIPGWQILSEGQHTVALDLTLTPELKNEGIAREIVNKIQNLRKSKDFEVTDKINVEIDQHTYTSGAIEVFKSYICGEILANDIQISSNGTFADSIEIDGHDIKINLTK